MDKYTDFEFEGKGVDTFLVGAYNETLGRAATEDELDELNDDFDVQNKMVEYNMEKYGYWED